VRAAETHGRRFEIPGALGVRWVRDRTAKTESERNEMTTQTEAQRLARLCERIDELDFSQIEALGSQAAAELRRLEAEVQSLRGAVPAGMMLAPVSLLKRAESSLGSFCSDEGWGAADMEVMDDISAMLAAAPQPALVPAGWVPLTEKLINSQEPWLYEPCWLAFPSGAVLKGVYEWRQGRDPDRFYTDGGGDYWAFDATHVMPVALPEHPAAPQPTQGETK
jgi:hypothetical protein